MNNNNGHEVIEAPIVGEHKGYPTLRIPTKDGDTYGFTFGLTKARAILKNLDAIRRFVESEGKEA